MPLVRGPFDVKLGDNTLSEIEEISVEYEQNSNDYDTVQGTTIEVDGTIKVSVMLTFLGTDIASMAAVLPQNFVENGGVMSTGETVNNADGAIDVAPAACTESIVYNNLDITACGAPADVFRVVNVRTKLDSVEFDGSVLRKVMVKAVGETAAGEGVVQMFKAGTINVIS